MCEYDGLVFKQPRDAEPAAAMLTENMPLNRGTATAQQVSQEQELACQRDSSATPSGVANATPGKCLGEGLHDDGSLEALCCSLFDAEASACSSDAVVEALRDICQRLCSGNGLAELQQELQRGIVAARAGTATPLPAPAEQEVEQGDYQVDLEARKAGLRARLAGYDKVRGACWCLPCAHSNACCDTLCWPTSGKELVNLGQVCSNLAIGHCCAHTASSAGC